MIIDTHTHIYLCEKNKEEDIMNNLWRINKIISIWVDIQTSTTSINLAKKYTDIAYATIWIHPCYIYDYSDKNIDDIFIELENMYLNNKEYIKWIWECWFDFYHIPEWKTIEDIKSIQEIFFKRQINLAKKYDLPIIIHTRNAKESTFEVLKETWFKKFILHCFSEDLEFATKCIDFSNECKISFSWIVTYKSWLQVQETAKNIDISKILVETDTPYLRPQELRWTENIPQNTYYNLEKIYYLKKENWLDISFEEFENIIYNNSKDFFKI